MSWSVYILKCADNSLYTGITTNVERRLYEHNSDNKKGARYTRARRPVNLIYQENYKNRSEASKREHVLKSMNRREKIQLIESGG